METKTRKTPPKKKVLVVNADDFGASEGINRGIMRAHDSGLVRSASLMVNMPSTEDAIRRRERAHDLGIGIHVNFTNEGDAVVPLDDVSACRDELYVQLERFMDALGRAPTHLDSHHNVHLHHPSLTGMFIEAGNELGIPLRGFSRIRYVSRFYGRWDGESHPEQLTVDSMLRIIDEELDGGMIEFSCHPGYQDPSFRSEYHRERELELQTLCDPKVNRALEERQVVLMSFAEIRQSGL